MILPDSLIKRAIERDMISIDPFNPEHVNPASYDVTLDDRLQINTARYVTSNVRSSEVLDLREVKEEYLTPHTMTFGKYALEPGEFILASTREVIGLDLTMAARIEGKSSLARVGLAVHVTGGFIDPGFEGQVTLEMVNLLHRPLILHSGMRIAQLAFMPMVQKPDRSYEATGHYQFQRGPTLSRYRIGEIK